MKKITSMVLLCLMMLGFTLFPTSVVAYNIPGAPFLPNEFPPLTLEVIPEIQWTQQHLKVKVANAPVRSKPSKEGNVVGRCYSGQILESRGYLINSKGNRWYLVHYNGSSSATYYIYSGNVGDAHTPSYNGTDYCSVCKFEKIHQSRYAQLFVARSEGVKSYSGPRESGVAKRVFRQYDRLDVLGRTRNEKNELWLKLLDGYIKADDTAFDFDASANKAYWYVKDRTVNEFVDGLASNISWLTAMFHAFGDNGVYDLKQASGIYPYTTLLGYNSYSYYIYSNGKIQTDWNGTAKRLTGVQLGNVQYGYVCARFGVSQEWAVRFPGAESLDSAIKCLNPFYSLDDKESICDNQTGYDYTAVGYNVYANRNNCSNWDFSVKSVYRSAVQE